MHAYNFKDLTGMVFGRFTVIGFGGRINKQTFWLCRCECGKEKIIGGSSLKVGRNKSCGCLRIENSTTHGLAHLPEYKVWNSMLQRCGNIKNKAYKNYGFRGITVCKRWEFFANFISDMGKRPSEKHSIERMDNNKGYSPDNCKWATRVEQSKNQRMRKTSTSGYVGVHLFKATGKYQAHIKPSGEIKRIHLGYFDNLQDAVEARKQAEIKYREKSS